MSKSAFRTFPAAASGITSLRHPNLYAKFKQEPSLCDLGRAGGRPTEEGLRLYINKYKIQSDIRTLLRYWVESHPAYRDEAKTMCWKWVEENKHLFKRREEK